MHVHPLLHTRYIKVRPSDIEYLKIRVQDPYHGDLIELNPGMSSFFKLDDVIIV